MAGRKPMLKSDIEVAQANTLSGAQAARYLNVAYNTYKKWASIYGIFESHKNEPGRGIGKNRIPSNKIIHRYTLQSIFEGKHPKYDRFKLKSRLISEGEFKEECKLCGYSEKRVIDGKVPLILDFIDGNKKNYKKENLRLLCFNCYFVSVGNLSGKKKDYIY